MSTPNIGNNTTSSARFSPITENDHAGYVWIVTIIGIVYTALSFFLRAWIKYRVYGWDDALIAAGTMMHMGQAISVFIALSYGLAKSKAVTSPLDVTTASKAFFAAEVMGLVVLGLAKCSVLALMLRVFTPETGMAAGHRACVALTILSAAWCVSSIVTISADCSLRSILTPESKEQCPDLLNRLRGITISEIITDVMTCLLPLWITMPLNMTSGVRFHVSLAFSFRIFVVPLAAFRLYYFRDAAESADIQLAVTSSVLFQQAAITVSLVSATIPNLRTFMESMNSSFNLPPLTVGETRGYALRTFGGSTMISSGPSGGGRHTTSNRAKHSKSLASNTSQNRDDPEELSLRPDGVHHEARISHGTHLSDSTSEEQHSLDRTVSEDRIITKRMEWHVRHETG